MRMLSGMPSRRWEWGKRALPADFADTFAIEASN